MDKDKMSKDKMKGKGGGKGKGKSTQRWPMCIFYSMVNVASINAWIIHCANDYNNFFVIFQKRSPSDASNALEGMRKNESPILLSYDRHNFIIKCQYTSFRSESHSLVSKKVDKVIRVYVQATIVIVIVIKITHFSRVYQG